MSFFTKESIISSNNYIKKNIFLILALVLFSVSLFFRFVYNPTTDIGYYQNVLQTYLQKAEAEAEKESLQLIERYNNPDSIFTFESTLKLHQTHKEENIYYYLYDAGKLVYWSDNKVPIDKFLLDIQFAKTVVKLHNGWYLPIVLRKEDVTCLTLILIKSVYQYHNAYLSDAYPTAISIPDHINISLQQNNNDIFGISGKYLCSLESTDTAKSAVWNEMTSLFFLLSLLFLIFYLLARVKERDLQRDVPVFTLLFCMGIIAIRVVSLYYQWPVFLYKTYLFSPVLYASSILFPSFGDLFINSFLFLFITFQLFTAKRRFQKQLTDSFYRYVFLLIGWILIFVVSFFGLYLVKGMILNSEISFEVNNIFALNIYSILGFVIMIQILLGLVLFIASIIPYVYETALSVYHHIFVLLILLISGYYLHYDDVNEFAIHFAGTIILSILCIYNFYRKRSIFRFSVLIPFIFVLSVISTISLITNNRYKEIENRKTLAISLSQDQDPLAEMTFSKIETLVVKDSVLLSYIGNNPVNESKVFDYLKQRYFLESWKKYDIQFTMCRGGDSLLIKPDNIQRNCFSFFNDLVYRQGRPTLSCNLYFLDKKNGRTSYIALLTFENASDSDARNTRIFIEFDSRFIPKGMGYPELLMDEKYEVAADISEYSFARYYNDQLMNQYGKHQYSLWLQQYGKISDNFTEVVDNEMHHLFYRYNKDSVLILSKKKAQWLELFTPFSYLFALISIIVFIIIFFVNKQEVNIAFFSKTLKSRIQFSMVIIVFVSLVIIGISSIIYIVNLYRTKNISDIKEKTHSIIIEMESKLGGVQTVDTEMNNYIQDVLIKFSNIFFTDINLYDTRGILISSSRSRVFKEGLIGQQMHSKAYSQMHEFNNTLFVHDESIGTLSYLSAYSPLRNNRNELIGYLNLPYFSKQSEMKNEISTFVVALINIYVLLFALAIVGAILVSNYITRPLRLIREKMGLLKLGTHTEKIEWKSRDEIGGLIDEYNRTVEQLEISAGLLAKSERESAWREMARQVAHEIKNPLTPMKLSVQYLEKAWNDKSPNWDERLSKFTKTMIEQIETLSNIATAFSDFAQLPHLRFEVLELNKYVSEIVDLYDDFDIKVEYSPVNTQKYLVLIDKNQINQVFTNIIKNGVQAITGDTEGHIFITIENTEKNEYLISIHDNGIGIDDTVRDKIFTPSFTTKTSGMGLGLAMVKSIIESHGGRIWFESEKGKGTTFFFTLPHLATQ